jgi:GT2 family glycosyltransferase
VAAVVLMWNDEGRVRALLANLARLAPGPGRVIVVDNASRDGAAARLAADFPGCRVIALPRNAGFAGGVNRGLEEASRLGAAWMWLLNSDLELPENALSLLLEAASKDPACGMAGALLCHADGREQARGGGRVSLWTGMVRHATSRAPHCDYLSGACLLLRAEMLDRIGAFDEGYFFTFEDVELGYRAREAGWSLAVADRCRVTHQEAASLGAWSERRWFLLFQGLRRFLESRSPAPRLALGLRLLGHSAAMARHGRPDALRGAWRGGLGPFFRSSRESACRSS